MTRKKTIEDYSEEQLYAALAKRFARETYRPGMTMSEMELAVRKAHGSENPTALRHLNALLAMLPLEKSTAKLCPKCGKRTPVKAKDRERSLRTLPGRITLTRNYHYCEHCQLGFYPLDLALDLPEEGELTREMEKRVLDFAVNDVYGECAARWRVHYEEPISENLLRRVAARVGAQCEDADARVLHEELKPVSDAPEVLVVEYDGSMLPIRGRRDVEGGEGRRHLPARPRHEQTRRRQRALRRGGEWPGRIRAHLRAGARRRAHRGCADGGVARRRCALQLDAG